MDSPTRTTVYNSKKIDQELKILQQIKICDTFSVQINVIEMESRQFWWQSRKVLHLKFNFYSYKILIDKIYISTVNLKSYSIGMNL